MAKLIFFTLASLDGYTEDEDGKFDWAAPDAEVHSFANELARPIGTCLYGRRMYETMTAWEDPAGIEGQPPHIREFAEIWQGAEKVVYSRSLKEPSTARTRIEREFDSAEVRKLKESADRDLMIGGPELAAEAFRAGLVDECQLLLVPAAVGGGKRALPDGVRLDLELLDERRFGNGTVFLRYRSAG